LLAAKRDEEVDGTLTERVSGRDGVHAQWVMSKELR